MKALFATALFVVCTNALSAQAITAVDIVSIDARYRAEAEYFYRENWLAFRKEALKKGVITSFRQLKTPPDSTGRYTLMLLTTFADSTAFAHREERFAPIMKAISPNGPRMLNQVPRSAFLKYVSGYDFEEVPL
jgi:hypothetical protein